MPALTKTSSSRPTPPWRPHNRNSPPQQGKGGNAAAAMTPACPKPTKNQSYAEPVQLSRPEYPSQSPTHHADTQISPITLKSSASKTPREKSGLDAREAQWREAVAAIRLLALTGCRRSEVLNLRWRDIGENALNLVESKTGPRAVPLGEAERALIDALPGRRKPDSFLFPHYAEGRGEYTASSPVGARSAKTPTSAGSACMTFGTPPPARLSWRARTCLWSASC